MKIFPIILFSVFSFLSDSHAQETTHRTCRIVFPGRPADAPKRLHLFDGTSSQEIELPSMNLSPVYNLPAGAIHLKFFTSKPEDSKSVSPDAPSVEIPENYHDFYLIVASDPENKIAAVKLKAINIESANFKLGQTLWINHTDQTIEGKLGDRVLSLGPNSSKILDSPFIDKSGPTRGYYHASFTYQIRGEDTFAPITEQQWWHDATSRHLGFIEHSGGKLPKIYVFRDFRDPEPKDK
jgi:hypothetical protein